MLSGLKPVLIIVLTAIPKATSFAQVSIINSSSLHHEPFATGIGSL